MKGVLGFTLETRGGWVWWPGYAGPSDERNERENKSHALIIWLLFSRSFLSSPAAYCGRQTQLTERAAGLFSMRLYASPR